APCPRLYDQLKASPGVALMTQSCCNLATLQRHHDLCWSYSCEKSLPKDLVGFDKPSRIGQQPRGRQSIQIAAETPGVRECGECGQGGRSVAPSESEIPASRRQIVSGGQKIFRFRVRNDRIVDSHQLRYGCRV